MEKIQRRGWELKEVWQRSSERHLFAHSNNDVGVAASNVPLGEIDASVDVKPEKAMEVLHPLHPLPLKAEKSQWGLRPAFPPNTHTHLSQGLNQYYVCPLVAAPPNIYIETERERALHCGHALLLGLLGRSVLSILFQVIILTYEYFREGGGMRLKRFFSGLQCWLY